MDFNVMYGVFCIKIDKNQKYIFNCHDFWKLICEDVIDDDPNAVIGLNSTLQKICYGPLAIKKTPPASPKKRR